MTAVEIRPPELTGGTEAEQLRKIQSYLYMLAEQLQFAFDGVSREQEAVQTQVTRTAEKQEAARSFTNLKALILRSAEITAVLEERMEKTFNGLYVAKSQFGDFEQRTQQRIEANSQELRQEFSHFQKLETDVEQLRETLLEVNASIRTGLLAYRDTGEPVYGVEIGQQERQDGVVRFRKFARLTAEKLSFFDQNEVEVACISDRRLHVTGASVSEITAGSAAVRRLQMGEYTWQLGTDGHLSLR